jgi:predicted heme/steroid binding protein
VQGRVWDAADAVIDAWRDGTAELEGAIADLADAMAALDALDPPSR